MKNKTKKEGKAGIKLNSFYQEIDCEYAVGCQHYYLDAIKILKYLHSKSYGSGNWRGLVEKILNQYKKEKGLKFI